MSASVSIITRDRIRRAAVLSPDGEYRYALWRWWLHPERAAKYRTLGPRRVAGEILVPDRPTVLWVMLNPSTADAELDDPTIRRCMDFTARWSGEVMAVVNLFARRGPDPRVLTGGDPIGPETDAWIRHEASRATRIVCAWGAGPRDHNLALDVLERSVAVEDLLRRCQPDRDVVCLGHTKKGAPRHPLYVTHAQAPLSYLPPLLR